MASADRPTRPSTTTRRTLIAGGAALCGLMLTHSGRALATSSEAVALIEALRDGGHIVYFRHAATTWSGIDSVTWPRDQQRQLSERGIDDSVAIGSAFARHEIPVGDILASPFARTSDMAMLAFGRVEEQMALIGLLSDDGGQPERVAHLTTLLSTPPATGTNRIIISHRSNIQTVAGVRLEEGEAVVVAPLGDGGFRVLGTLMPADW